jgi:hypothetical protein
MTVNNSILKTLNTEINILLSTKQNKDVYRFFTKILGKNNVYEFEDTAYLHRPIHAVVCVNKLETIKESLEMAYYLHVPIIIIDIKSRPDYFPKHEYTTPDFTHIQLSTNINVAKSWGIDSYHDIVDMDVMNPESIKKWKEIIHNISRQTFKVETKQEKDTDYEEKQYSINIE